MKIVQINTVCGTGSTGKIMADLYMISSQNGHSAFAAYGRGTAPSQIQGFKIGNPLDFGCHVLRNFFQGKSGFGSVSVTKRFLRWLDQIKPDILHLHNLHGFYIHVGMLFTYIKSRNIPVVWTLHDCWPITGQCAHFDYVRCEKWKIGCCNCPIYRSDYPYSLFKDNSCQNYQAKKESFTKVSQMILATPSVWLANIIKQSFLQEYPTVVIPNGINLDIFHPSSAKKQNRTEYILGVANGWPGKKGLQYFLRLADMPDFPYHIVLIGVTQRQKRELQKKYGSRLTPLTRTANQNELAGWYSHALAYVNPTLEDNFPTTNLEALACGTPVITFNTGGSPESLTPHCGLVVEKGNVEQLKNAILSIGQDPEITREACRLRAMEYDKNTRFSEYLKLYEKLYSAS